MGEFYGEEQILLKRIAAGDKKAFTLLYTGYIENVYDYIYLFTKSDEETKEILQDVFVNIWENRERLVWVTSFKHYLFRAAKNKLINHVRHIKIKKRVFREISQNAASTRDTTWYELTYKEYHRLVEDAIEMLPPGRKKIFTMTIEENVSYEEIAERLNISTSVVKKQFYKARDFVRQYLYTKAGLLAILFISLIFFVTF